MTSLRDVTSQGGVPVPQGDATTNGDGRSNYHSIIYMVLVSI